MLIIGLTGSVASGKNFVADQFKKFHIPVFDADLVSHQILVNNKKVFQQIKNYFPGAIIKDQISREKLGQEVLHDRKKLDILEKIIHPQVRKAQIEFIKKSRYQGNKMVVLNVPLLFETNLNQLCDKTIAVITPQIIQKQRFFKRTKTENPDRDLMEKKFALIISHQINNHHKKNLADFIIFNGLDKGFTIRQIKKILFQILTYE